MAEQLYFSRDSKLYIEFDSYVWEVPVLDGFMFTFFNKNILNINLIIIDLVMIYALVKWEVFRSL